MTGQPINVINDIKSYQNGISQSISLPTNAYAKIVLTDIFDQTVEKRYKSKMNLQTFLKVMNLHGR